MENIHGRMSLNNIQMYYEKKNVVPLHCYRNYMWYTSYMYLCAMVRIVRHSCHRLFKQNAELKVRSQFIPLICDLMCTKLLDRTRKNTVN